MNSTEVYGDPENISVFTAEQPFQTKSGLKILSTEPYAKDLAKSYEDYFNGVAPVKKYSLCTGEVVLGRIVSINEDEISLDLGHRELAYVSVDKDKLNPSDFSIGQEIEVIITQDQERSEYLKASITGKIRKELYDDMTDWDSNKVYDAKVLRLSNNGYDLDILGLDVFMPGSLGGINRLVDFNDLVGKTIKVMTVKNNNSYSKYKNTLIVSHREYLKTLIPIKLQDLVVGDKYTGKVTDTTHFGIFVEFNEVLTGLIHKDEFDDGLKELFDNGDVKPGVEIEFFLKEIINPKRIILSRFEVDLTALKEVKYKKNEIVKGRVTKLTSYGAFVKFDKNTSGLVHISKMKNVEVERNDKVECKIININNGKYDLSFV